MVKAMIEALVRRDKLRLQLETICPDEDAVATALEQIELIYRAGALPREHVGQLVCQTLAFGVAGGEELRVLYTNCPAAFDFEAMVYLKTIGEPAPCALAQMAHRLQERGYV